MLFKSNMAAQFNISWKVSFPDHTPPAIPCLDEPISNNERGQDNQEYRKLLQKALDMQDEKIEKLNLELEKEQFVADYIAGIVEDLSQHPKSSHNSRPEELNLTIKEVTRRKTAPISRGKPIIRKKKPNRPNSYSAQPYCISEMTEEDNNFIFAPVSSRSYSSTDLMTVVSNRNSASSVISSSRDSFKRMCRISRSIDGDGLNDKHVSQCSSTTSSEYSPLWLAESWKPDSEHKIALSAETPTIVPSPDILRQCNLRDNDNPSADQTLTKETVYAGSSSSDQEDDKPGYVEAVYRRHMSISTAHQQDFLLSMKPRISPGDAESNLDSTDGGGFKLDSSDYETISSTQSDVIDSLPILSPDNDRTVQNMRKDLIERILGAELEYISDLDVLLKYKNNMEANIGTSQPLLNMDDINAIFGNLADIKALHTRFVEKVKPLISSWTPHTRVADAFMQRALEFECYQAYLSNYANSIETVQRCCQENAEFAKVVKKIKCPTKESMHLTEILYRPIIRMQRNTLDLQEFTNATPESHADYPHLKQALAESQSFLDNIKVDANNNPTPLHVLVKSRLVVEHVGSKARKLRNVLLFHNIIICTKMKQISQAKDRYPYEVKWFAPLSQVEISEKIDDTPVQWKQKQESADKEITQMKNKLRELKDQLRRELRECRDRHISTDSSRVQRFTRQIQTQEGKLLLAEPRLSLTLKSGAKQRVFLLASDYERREWIESIQNLKHKAQKSTQEFTLSSVQAIVDSCREHIKMSNSDDLVQKAADETVLNGQLTVTIHKMHGLHIPCSTFTAMEVDTFGHFYQKAKTTTMPETFEIDLESSSTLRLICYRIQDGSDMLLGKSKFELNAQWLKNGFSHKTISMGEVTLEISIKYKTAAQTISRKPSHLDAGLFGMSLPATCDREDSNIPRFIEACLEDVEKRGLNELGIYRVSASVADVQRVKRAFDKSVRIGKKMMEDVDVNAVTGALKLYFRELPEALFTDRLYSRFVEKYGIADEALKRKEMVALLSDLPDPNYHTTMALLKHLIVIASNESVNKMTLNNLAVVFGPTLLKPAEPLKITNPMDLLNSSTNDAGTQSALLYYFLNLVKEGTKFR